MKIGYFTSIYPRATDTFIRNEVIGLRKRGFQVNTFSLRDAGIAHSVNREIKNEQANTTYILPLKFKHLLLACFYQILCKPKRFLKVLCLAISTSRKGWEGRLKQFAYLSEAILLSQHIKTQKVEHLHNHLGDSSGTVTMLAAKLSGIEFSISVHGPHLFFKGSEWALDKKLELATFIACIGHFCKSQMMLYTNPAHWEKLKIVRCGVIPDELGFNGTSKKIQNLLFVGRLSKEKGLNVLLRALFSLKEQGYDLNLRVVGDGEQNAEYQRLAKKLRLEDDVHFLGFQSSQTVYEELQRSDLFILPSFAEGIPVALMEAMAIGKPVIATHVGGISELITDGVTGKLVYASDVQSLEDAIKFFIKCDDKEKIVNAARAKIVKDFDLNKQVDKLADLFKASAGENGNG